MSLLWVGARSGKETFRKCIPAPPKWIFRDLLLPSGQVSMGSGCEDEAGAQDTRLEQKILKASPPTVIPPIPWSVGRIKSRGLVVKRAQ